MLKLFMININDMYISPINHQIQNRKILFHGNTSPRALAKARECVFKELDISTGTSFITEFIKNRNDVAEIQNWNDFFAQLKNNVHLADTVEKLELLKTYALSLVGGVAPKDFLKFLKSKRATDKNIYFLQHAMNAGYDERVTSLVDKGYLDHWVMDIFAPVFKYVSGKNKSPHFGDYPRGFEDRLVLINKLLERAKRGISSIDRQQEFALPFSQQETDIALNLARSHKTKGVSSENLISIEKLKTRDSYVSAVSSYYEDKTTGKEYIEMCLEHSRDQSLLPYFSKGYGTIDPMSRQLFIRFDKRNNLMKVKMFDYQEEEKEKLGPAIYSICKDSAFVKYPDFIINALRNKYIAESIEYDAKTGIVTYCNNLRNASIVDGSKSEKRFTMPYKLIKLPKDTKEFHYGNGNKKFTFSPLEPTASELYRMLNNTGENNLILALECSNWKNAFIKLIEDGTL